MKKIYAGILIFFVCFPLLSKAQVNVRDSAVFAPLFNPHAGFWVPLGDFSSRFGPGWQIGGSILFKHKSNFIWGASGAYLFSESIRDSGIMQNILPIVSADGSFPSIGLNMQGMLFLGHFGKIFPVSKKPNKNSGIITMLGVGFIQHQIRFDIRGDLAPQAEGVYQKGYDRLTNGLALSQFIGYMFLGNNRRVNFFGGLEITQGFTQNRRGFNYDTGLPDTDSKFDMMIGVKLGWIFPAYKRTQRTYYN